MTFLVLSYPKQTSQHNPGRFLGTVTLSDSTDIPSDARRNENIFRLPPIYQGMKVNSKCGHSLHGKLSEQSAWMAILLVRVPEKFLAYFCNIQIMSIPRKIKCFTVFPRLFTAFRG